MRLIFVIAFCAAGALASDVGDEPETPPNEEPRTITRADLERRISELDRQRQEFQQTIDRKIDEYNTETQDIRQEGERLVQEARSNPQAPDFAKEEQGQEKIRSAEDRQAARDADRKPDLTYERGQIQEREQKIGKLRTEIDKMAGNDQQNPFQFPKMEPPGGDEGGGDSDGKSPLPGEDLLMNDQRLDAAGNPTSMTRAEMDAHYGQPKVGGGAGAGRVGARGRRVLDSRNKIAAAATPNFTGGRRGSGFGGPGRPGSVGRSDGISGVRSNARTGWIPGGRFARSGGGAPIADGDALPGGHTGSSSWSNYGKGKKFRTPETRSKKARAGSGGAAGAAAAAAGKSGKPMSLAERLLQSMSNFKNKWFPGEGGTGGAAAGRAVDPSWGEGSVEHYGPGHSPGRSLVGDEAGPGGVGDGRGAPAYARSGAALDAEGSNWLSYWPYILAVLLAIIGVGVWKLDFS
jgi:Skp family chaperone for outer membrane proteins